ncbi:hypothetical protein SAMN05421786_103329 [Chryseobacterium ureilyticum]|uniref:Uncharacterized protein n=1 Tax=Chryseobacterium ureilyticum TaxID=373668 RepID=A0A1N7N9L9_9FLAO|nr:hypothetical protein [Chryseobacterium ureilyticum]SIS95022.1 hypothetical protein SAMN05421786_103329 [Chryseobacterium ureilyticum]
MITDKDLDFLYYITPEKYRFKLDGGKDPNASLNYEKKKQLQQKLLKCSKYEFIETIIKVFKNKYANAQNIWLITIDYDIVSKTQTPLRKDLKNVVFDFRNEVKNIANVKKDYLNNLFIEFDSVLPELENTIVASLKGKVLNKDFNNSKTVFYISNSPIQKIEITSNSFHMFINKNSFIDYGRY